MTFYRLLQGLVVLAEAVLLYFFVTGLGDGSITGSNLLIWIILLGVPTAALIIASHLHRSGNAGLAKLLLAIPAVPALCYGLFVLLIVILAPDFR
jgi:hypothetical protein